MKDSKFILNDFVQDSRGLTAYQVFSLDKKKKEAGEKETYFTEEIIAMILKYGRTLSEKQADGWVTDCVITIPSYFTREQRLMMNQAADLAGLNVLQMVHENVAAATYFALERLDVEKALHVMFYNMGGQDTEVTIARYSAVTNERNKTIEMVEILAESYDKNLGGGEFDDILVNIMADEFNNMKERKGKEDVRKNIRAVKRLYKEASKVKDILSANKAINIKVPELLDYVTLKFNLDRTTFEAKCESLFAKVAAPAEEAL